MRVAWSGPQVPHRCGRKASVSVYRHVLCVYPYRVEPAGARYWPPAGLEVIAAALEKHAPRIDVVDHRMERRRTVDFLRPETDLVAFSVNWERDVGFVSEEIRSVPPEVLTIVGGRHVTEDPEKWLSDCPNVGIVVRGDGEEIIEEIAQGLPLDEIAGVSYRLNGRVVHGPVRHVGPVSEDLYPNRRLRRYAYSLAPHDYDTSLTVDTLVSSRGCPFNCTFCSFSRNPWGEKRSWSARSPESVVRELEEIDSQLVIFVDDLFTHDMDRVGAICDLIQERGIRQRYVVNARVEIARRPDVLRKMARAGFVALRIGIESAQDRTLRSMRKGFNTKQLREYFRVLKRSRMLLNGYFIVGNIGETEEEMLQIAPFARELGLDTITLCLLRNEPYSGLDELIARNPGYHIAPDHSVYSDEFSRGRLRRIRHRIHRRFYSLGQVFKMVRKFLKSRIVGLRVAARLPWLMVRLSLETWQRRRLRRKRKRGMTAMLEGPPVSHR